MAPSQLLKSTDGGQNWTRLLYPSILQRLALVPTTSPSLIGFDPQGFRRSTDGGQTWTQFTINFRVPEHGEVIAVDPMNPATIYLGTNFAMHKSADGKQLAYSTYLGGSGNDAGLAIAVGGGNAYVTGFTSSFDFPVVNAPQPKRGGRIDSTSNAFVTRLQANGAPPLYSTYLGGSNSDGGAAIAVDARGSVYVAGSSNSTDFPVTPDALRKTLAQSEGFVARLALNADLALSLADLPDPVRPPGTLTYRIQIVNQGPDAAQDVRLTDTLPANAQLVRDGFARRMQRHGDDQLCAGYAQCAGHRDGDD